MAPTHHGHAHHGPYAPWPLSPPPSTAQVALLTVEGTGTSAVPDLVERLFQTMRIAGISPLMHTQASAESSICLVVEEGDAQA